MYFSYNASVRCKRANFFTRLLLRATLGPKAIAQTLAKTSICCKQANL